MKEKSNEFNIDFSELIQLRESIDAPLAKLSKVRETEIRSDNPFEIEILKGGEVTLSGEELNQQLRGIGGLLAIGNTQITLHIEEPWQDKESLSQILATNPKYHVSDCKTLEKMRDGGRFDRYVTSNKNDGNFTVVPYDHETRNRDKKMRASLQPCRNCLSKINYNGYVNSSKLKQDEIVKNSDLENFFAEFSATFRSLPRYNEETYPSGGYPNNWSQITNAKREQNEWKCSCCKVDLYKNKHLLHTHHKDGVGGNVRDKNLVVLCLLCHSTQPFHAHMRVSGREKIKIKNLRFDQKLERECNNCL